MAQYRLGTLADIPAGRGRRFEIAGRRLAVFNVDGCLLAIDDECPHEGGPLSEGEVSNECVSCPWHGAEFNLRTGKVLTPPAVEDVRSYKISLSGNEVFAEID